MYVLSNVEVYTSRSSRVYHVAPHECVDVPHTLCGLKPEAASRLVKATPKQTQARTLCWSCRKVLIARADDLQAAKSRG